MPCIIVSPWTAGGWVSSQKFDQTSVLQFLERITKVKEPNITAWRQQTFGDLTSVFRHDKPAHPPVMPNTGGQLNLASYEISQLSCRRSHSRAGPNTPRARRRAPAATTCDRLGRSSSRYVSVP